MAIAQSHITVANRVKDDYDFHAKDTSLYPNEQEEHKLGKGCARAVKDIDSHMARGRPSGASNSVTTTATAVDDDVFDEILSLKLRKPKHWKWELSTSATSPHLILPRILLYDHKDNLLVDVRAAASDAHQLQVYNENNDYEYHHHNCQKKQLTPTFSQSYSRPSYDLHINDLTDYMRTLNASPATTTTSSTTTATTSATSSSSRRGFRRRLHRQRSSSLAPTSVQSPSILERLSFRKGRSSSPESSVEDGIQEQIIPSGDNEVIDTNQYFLRSSKAGTLMVKEDSFIRHPHRRRRLPARRVSSTNGQRLIPLEKGDMNNISRG